MPAYRHALVIRNRFSGHADGQHIADTLAAAAPQLSCTHVFVEKGEDAERVTLDRLPGRYDVVVAAGGDGTVGSVARAAREFDLPVAILPTGTANMLAVQLGIPTDVGDAAALLSGRSRVRRIDGMVVRDRLYFLNVGVGLSASTIRDLKDWTKRYLGLSAYVWTGIASGFTMKPARCRITLDGRARRMRILDVSVINAGFNEVRSFPGFPVVLPDDGKLNVLTVWTPTPVDYLRHLWWAFTTWRRVRKNIRWRVAERDVRVESSVSLPVQADGDIIGETPVCISLVPSAVGIVVPDSEEGALRAGAVEDDA